MHTDSRKAQRNSYAHHRAYLLFSTLPATGKRPLQLPMVRSADASLTQLVRQGIIGFASMAPQPGALSLA